MPLWWNPALVKCCFVKWCFDEMPFLWNDASVKWCSTKGCWILMVTIKPCILLNGNEDKDRCYKTFLYFLSLK
jgi:hypothetical protein